MRRYWVDDDLEIGVPFAVSGDLFKHVHTVCRQGIGSEFELLPALRSTKLSKHGLSDKPEAASKKAFLYHVKVIDIFRHTMVVDVLSKRSIPVLPKPHIHLALSLPKLKTLESVVEKIVELGVFSITPFYSDFSFFKSKDKIGEKSQRLRKIVTSACQQSARAEELIIQPTQSLQQVLETSTKEFDFKTTRVLAFYEGRAQSLSSYMDKQNPDDSQINNLWVFIGSEGGFSELENKMFKDFGVPSLSLGEQVLRVETACVSIVSVLKYKYDLF